MMQHSPERESRPANHPAKIQRTDEESDNGDYAEYLGRQADAWCQNPPAAPPGFELIPCAHEPRHWPTYTIVDDDFYPASCPHCWTSSDRETIRDLEHRLHKWWMRSRRVQWLVGRASSLGLITGYGLQNCHACPSWVLIRPIHWKGKRNYVLGLSRGTWGCLRRGHLPADPIAFGMCSKCLPCPACGSKTAGHSAGCSEAA